MAVAKPSTDGSQIVQGPPTVLKPSIDAGSQRDTKPHSFPFECAAVKFKDTATVLVTRDASSPTYWIDLINNQFKPLELVLTMYETHMWITGKNIPAIYVPREAIANAFPLAT